MAWRRSQLRQEAEAEEARISRSTSGASSHHDRGLDHKEDSQRKVFLAKKSDKLEQQRQDNSDKLISAVEEEEEEDEWTQLCNLNNPNAKRRPRVITSPDNNPGQDRLINLRNTNIPQDVHRRSYERKSRDTPTPTSTTSSELNEWEELCMYFKLPPERLQSTYKARRSETTASGDSKRADSSIFEMQEMNKRPVQEREEQTDWPTPRLG
jgi:hypothetical protein